MQKITTAVLIIGSGFGAAAPGLRLSQAGIQVCMIEKGEPIIPEKDFRQTQDPRYFLQYLKSLTGASVSFTYAEALGGGSGFYEMVSLRAPSVAFDQKDAHGRSLWPDGVTRTTLDPYYDVAEKMLRVEQVAAEQIPRSGVVFSLLMKRLGYTCDRARYAVQGCKGSGYCISGCMFGAKQSLHVNYLPQAEQAGMQILTRMEALVIRPQPVDPRSARRSRHASALPYRYEVHCRDTKTGEAIAIQAQLVILGGGTVGTATLLLNSRPFLPRLSRHVGQHIAFNGSVKVAGLLPDGFIDGDMFTGMSHAGMISYHFLASHGITIAAVKPLPLQLLSKARLLLDGDTPSTSFWGKGHVALMQRYRRRMIVLYALGLTPPCAALRRKGGRTFVPHVQVDAALRAYYQTTHTLLRGIFLKNGCNVVNAQLINTTGDAYDDIHFATTHMVGSCRMANRKADGVTNNVGEIFDYPGLYVTDGAAIPTSLAVNASLTILANAERIAAHLVRQYGHHHAPLVCSP